MSWLWAHGVFMKFLTGDLEIDLPKSGWKSYTFRKDNEMSFCLFRLKGRQIRTCSIQFRSLLPAEMNL
jgi:hypothetical protein